MGAHLDLDVGRGCTGFTVSVQDHCSKPAFLRGAESRIWSSGNGAVYSMSFACSMSGGHLALTLNILIICAYQASRPGNLDAYWALLTWYPLDPAPHSVAGSGGGRHNYSTSTGVAAWERPTVCLRMLQHCTHEK